MSRRTGKAATRRARQQKRARQGPSQAASPAAVPTPSAAPAVPAPDSEPSVDAMAAPVKAPSTPRWQASSSSSRLAESARAEYHYVGRDLRNTLVLMVVMAAILAVAVVIVNASGVIPS
jgi:hypothetical protein